MAAVTICSDFWSPKKQSLSLFPLFPHLFVMKWWDWIQLFGPYPEALWLELTIYKDIGT